MVKKQAVPGLDFIIDKLTNSIENVITGDSFATEISILTTSDLKLITKKKGWLFNGVKNLRILYEKLIN